MRDKLKRRIFKPKRTDDLVKRLYLHEYERRKGGKEWYVIQTV